MQTLVKASEARERGYAVGRGKLCCWGWGRVVLLGGAVLLGMRESCAVGDGEWGERAVLLGMREVCAAEGQGELCCCGGS